MFLEVVFVLAELLIEILIEEEDEVTDVTVDLIDELTTVLVEFFGAEVDEGIVRVRAGGNSGRVMGG